MSFLYPSFLWAIALVAIPVIIHLFNFKVHKIVYFSNIRFLANIKDVSESKSKIKNLLILMCRIFTVLGLVIAFSGPFIPLSQNVSKSAKSVVCIYLDNSFSMNANSVYGNLFDASKERIRKIVNSYPPSQEFVFVTNDLEPRHRIITNKEQLNVFINQCQISPSFRTVSEIDTYLHSFLKQEKNLEKYRKLLYLVSDFQKVSTDFEKIKSDTTLSYHLLPMASNSINNLYIDSCWFSKTGRRLNKPDELVAKIVNHGSEALSDIPLRLFVNGRQIAISSFNIEANQSLDVPVQFTNTESGILGCYLEISDYPITYDNKLYFSYEIKKQTSVLVINNKSENKYISALLSNDSSFNVKQIYYGSIKTSEFVNYQVIILDEPGTIPNGLSEELVNFVSNGGSIVLMPSAESNIEELNKLLLSLQGPQLLPLVNQEIQIDKINFQHFLYKDVFSKTEGKLNLPGLKSYFNLKPNNQNPYNEVFNSSSGKPLLVQHDYKKGKVYTFSFPVSVSNSDFMLHQLFVPTIYNMVAFSQGNDNLYFIAGKDNVIEINLKPSQAEEIIHMVGQSANTDFIPHFSGIGEIGQRLDLMHNLLWADNYYIKDKDSILKCISFNFNRKESITDYYSNTEIQNLITKNRLSGFNTISSNINDLELEIVNMQKERKELWKLFILISFLSIVGEILIIRLWKDRKKTAVQH